jgi:hypothetical protein
MMLSAAPPPAKGVHQSRCWQLERCITQTRRNCASISKVAGVALYLYLSSAQAPCFVCSLRRPTAPLRGCIVHCQHLPEQLSCRLTPVQTPPALCNPGCVAHHVGVVVPQTAHQRKQRRHDVACLAACVGDSTSAMHSPHRLER